MTTIRFEGVSKRFRQRHANAPDGDLWAVREVDFTVEEGEVVGLIGRNGCGKSTVLKLAARVTSLSSGRITTVKPIAPMLELGAGFHPDLTGRDNIRLNGSFLGMGRKLTTRQMDEIVAFAEVEQHIDTPVKHYSSGMTARLGFAVAVHSGARLLLVDEVLSVGDKLFRQKCIQRMRYLRDQGTSIMLVSHDDGVIRNFCTRALTMESGRVLADTTPDEALRQYDLRLYRGLGTGHEGVTVETVEVMDATGTPIGRMIGSTIRVRIRYAARGTDRAWTLVARVRREDGVYCATCSVDDVDRSAGEAMVEISDLNLVVGRYCMEVSIEETQTFFPLSTQISKPFDVWGPFNQKRGYDGVIQLRQRWSFE